MSTRVNNVTIPDTAEGLAELLSDEELCASVFSDADTRKDFFTAYNRAVNAGDKITTQVNEQVQATLMDWLKDNGAQTPDMSEMADALAKKLKPLAVDPNGKDSATYNPKAMGAVLDGDYTDAAGFFHDIWHNTAKTPEIVAKHESYRNAFGSSVPSEGGFLIPERLRAELLRVALETAIVRPRARVIPMDSLRVPFPAIDSSSNVSSVHGGIVAYWTEEGAALTESEATFGRIVLDAKKLTAYTEVPNELLSDSLISFQAFINQIFPEALSFYEDIAFITGSGAGEPKGFLNADAAIVVAKESGQPDNTIVWENLVKMFSRMLPSSLSRAVWLVSVDTFPELATMALSVGTGGSAIWLNNGVEGPPAKILGRPVIITEKVPKLGDEGDVNFVDFGFYLIGDRQVMSAKSSEHFKFQNDVTAFRIIERLDGRPWLQSAITPQNGGATVSPFVKLAAR